jgi:hypothetical protein
MLLATMTDENLLAARWRIERVFADGRSELVTLAGEAWEGPEDKARKRAEVMQREEPDVTFRLVPPQTIATG